MSTDTKFTPGPWLFRNKSDTMHTKHPDYPYGAAFFGFDSEFSPNEADINLIVAAPDMYEALAAILPFVPKTSASEGGASMFSENVRAADKVRAALAKARGEG